MAKKGHLVAEATGGYVVMGELVGEITGGLREMQLDPDIVDEIHSALRDVADLLHDDRFGKRGTIEQTSFGARQSGEDLSYHHGRAHQVMTDTLVGITQDIAAFARNIKKAAEEILETDQTAVQDLGKRLDATEAIMTLGKSSYGDKAYDRSRNNVRDPFHKPGRFG